MRLVLRHAWLNLWDKHMTTGRINQVSRLEFSSNQRSNPPASTCIKTLRFCWAQLVREQSRGTGASSQHTTLPSVSKSCNSVQLRREEVALGNEVLQRNNKTEQSDQATCIRNRNLPSPNRRSFRSEPARAAQQLRCTAQHCYTAHCALHQLYSFFSFLLTMENSPEKRLLVRKPLKSNVECGKKVVIPPFRMSV